MSHPTTALPPCSSTTEPPAHSIIIPSVLIRAELTDCTLSDQEDPTLELHHFPENDLRQQRSPLGHLPPTVAHATIFDLLPDTRLWDSSNLSRHSQRQHLDRPPSPPQTAHDPDETFAWSSGSSNEMSITHNLPFSPLASPTTDSSGFSDSSAMSMQRSISAPALSYAPFRSSPLANISARATILRISETGEMEMEDAVSDDTEDFVMAEAESEESMETDEFHDFQASGLSSIAAEGLFRAGTPTPVITPPFPQVVVPQIVSNNEAGILSTGGPATLMLEMPGMEPVPIEPVFISPDDISFDMTSNEDAIDIQDELTGIPHEISTEELDTECLLLSEVNLMIVLDVRRRNFWNSWLRYRYRKQTQQGLYSTHVGSDWSELLSLLMDRRPVEITEDDHDKGMDIQGLSWGIGDIPVKEDFREKRVKDYGSLIVKPPPQPAYINPAHDPSRIHNFYKFRYTNLKHRCSLHHFQLRYLLSATSKNDLYYIYDDSLRRWDTMARTSDLVYNFKQSRQAPWKGWMPSTLSCGNGIAAVGGYSGEYAIIPLNTRSNSSVRIGSLAHCQFITNHVDVIQPREGGVRVVWANNDAMIRQQDVETGQFIRVHALDWPINATSTSPDGRIRAAVGDAKEVILMDANRGEVIKTLWGHNHWSFAVDWKNDGYTFVTGNQDMSARLWDARKMSDSFLTLPAKMGAIRSVHFSPDGKYLAIAEPADYVHIYDASTGLYEDKQSIEFIGETAGVSFDPTGESLFIGNADDLVGSIYEFSRVRGKECQQSWEDLVL